MKLTRLRKVTWKLILVYTIIIVTLYFADRSPQKWLRWNFWAGIALLAITVWLRLWAAGHLIKNKVLTVTGPYAYVKNPLYIGTFLGMIGFALLAMGDLRDPWYFRYLNWMLLSLGVVVFVAYYVPYKKKREGEHLRLNFGEAWDHYDKAVPDYFPKLARYERAATAPWSWAAACENSEQWAPLFIALGVVVVVFNQRIIAFIERLAS